MSWSWSRVRKRSWDWTRSCSLVLCSSVLGCTTFTSSPSSSSGLYAWQISNVNPKISCSIRRHTLLRIQLWDKTHHSLVICYLEIRKHRRANQTRSNFGHFWSWPPTHTILYKVHSSINKEILALVSNTRLKERNSRLQPPMPPPDVWTFSRPQDFSDQNETNNHSSNYVKEIQSWKKIIPLRKRFSSVCQKGCTLVHLNKEKFWKI